MIPGQKPAAQKQKKEARKRSKPKSKSSNNKQTTKKSPKLKQRNKQKPKTTNKQRDHLFDHQPTPRSANISQPRWAIVQEGRTDSEVLGLLKTTRNIQCPKNILKNRKPPKPTKTLLLLDPPICIASEKVVLSAWFSLLFDG